MNEETLRKYYEEYLEFDNFLEFRIFDYQEKFPSGGNKMFSLYAQNFEEVQKILKDYGFNARYNVYVSSNTRKKKGRKDVDVSDRRIFFFDIEADGDKPPYTDKIYYKKLKETVAYIIKDLKKYGLEPNLLKESGRGLHLGYKVIPMANVTYDKRFKQWYKYTINRLMKDRPYEDIKFSDNMANPSRIESAPGARHMKYPEKPLRQVLSLRLHENNMLKVLNNFKFIERKRTISFSSPDNKYNDNTFYKKCPEFLLLKDNPDLPEGELHSKILLNIKILVRDNDLDVGKIQEELNMLGYNEDFNTLPNEEDYHYNPNTVFNWCMKNYAYCLEKKIKVPNTFGETPIIVSRDYMIDEDPDDAKNYPVRDLVSYRDVIEYIKEFNDRFSELEGNKFYIYKLALINKIKKRAPEKLVEYIEFLELWDFILCQYRVLQRK